MRPLNLLSCCTCMLFEGWLPRLHRPNQANTLSVVLQGGPLEEGLGSNLGRADSN